MLGILPLKLGGSMRSIDTDIMVKAQTVGSARNTQNNLGIKHVLYKATAQSGGFFRSRLHLDLFPDHNSTLHIEEFL